MLLSLAHRLVEYNLRGNVIIGCDLPLGAVEFICIEFAWSLLVWAIQMACFLFFLYVRSFFGRFLARGEMKIQLVSFPINVHGHSGGCSLTHAGLITLSVVR